MHSCSVIKVLLQPFVPFGGFLNYLLNTGRTLSFIIFFIKSKDAILKLKF